MGLFGFGKNKNETANNQTAPAAPVAAPDAAPQATAAPSLDLGKKSGKIDLTKGAKVTIGKSAVITARASWSSNTDYDLYALVLTKDGQVHTVSTFGTHGNKHSYQTSVLNGAVRHLGDVGRGVAGTAQETIEIRMTPDVVAVVPVAYSAQSNGTGSFRRYNVSLSIDNGAGDQVNVSSQNASDNDKIYSVAIGVIRNTADGTQVEALESYSQPGSENRPALGPNGEVVMDRGPRNAYK